MTAASLALSAKGRKLRPGSENGTGAAQYETSLDEASVKLWPGAVRVAVFAAAVVLPWSLVALAVRAVVR